MTRLDDLLALSPDGQSAVEMFILKEPVGATGAHTVQVTLVAGVNYAVGGSVSFNDVNQVTPTRIFTRNSGTNSPATVTVASATNEIVLDTVATKFEAGILTAGAGQTERWNGKDASCFGGLNSVGAGSTKPGATTTTMTWTEQNSQPWAIGAVSIVPLAPTEVRLSSLTAAQAVDGVRLNWETGYEVNNLGFNIYREEDGHRVRVNPSLIAGSAFLAGTPLTAGFTYSWLDPAGTADSLYTLEDIDLDGTHTLHGPVAPIAAGSGNSPASKQSALLAQVAEPTQATVHSGPALFARPQVEPAPKKMSAAADAPPNPLAAQPAVKLSIRKEGFYRADLSALVANGLDPASNPLSLQLYADGLEQAINVNSNTLRADGGGYIEFYGTGLDTPSTDTRTYWLVAGSGHGRRINTFETNEATGGTASGPAPGVWKPPATPRANGWIYLPFIRIFTEAPQPLKKPSEELKPASIRQPESAAAPAVRTIPKQQRKRKRSRQAQRERQTVAKHHPALTGSTPLSYACTVERRDRKIYFSALLNGDAENFFGQILASTPVEQTLNLRYLDTASGNPAQLEVSLQGATTQPHQVQVQLNGTEVGTLSYAGMENSSALFTINPALLREGDNTVRLTALGGSSDVSLVDHLKITYAHLYRAESDRLNFSAAGSSRVNVEGFSSPGVRVLDITNPNEVEEIIPQVKAQGATYTITIEPGRGGGTRNLLALTDDRFERPDAITFNRPSHWSQSSNAADFLIITDRQFRPSLKALAQLRAGQGLAVAVIDVEDIFDEFSYGAHRPQAIKEFLSATTRWQKAPRSVLFVGDASYDPRNYQGKGEFDFIPTKMLETRYLETAGDDWFADFNNDGVPELAVGRLPVRTNEEARAIISKIVSYRAPADSSGRGVLLVSDKVGPDGFNFESTSNELRAFIPGSVGVQSIVRHEEDGSTLRSEIINSLNQGPLITNYAGHGTYDKWTGDGVLRTADTISLADSGRTTLVLTMTCMNGYYVDTTTDSLAEALLKTENGGAVAVWASSGITLPTRQAEINQKLYQQLFGSESLTLGEAVQRAKAATTDADVRRTWILFGDPTMRLR